MADFTVVIPMYNEIELAETFLAEVKSSLAGNDVAVIVVDDGSKDGTSAKLDTIGSSWPSLRVIHLDPNRGQTAAMAEGIHAATTDIVCIVDGDGQNDPADLIPFYKALRDASADVGVVAGYRAERKDSGWKLMQSRIANTVRNWIVPDGVRDTGCGTKALRREAIDGLLWYRGMHRFIPALAQMRSWTVIELPAKHRPRAAGQSKYTALNRTFAALRDAFAVRWMRSRYVERGRQLR